MKTIGIAMLIFLCACGGSLSEEQRKQMREARENQVVQRVTDADVTEGAFKKGRLVMKALEQRKFNAEQIDSIANISGIIIHWLEPGNVDGLEIEKQLIEAYIVSAATGDEQPDNVQRVGTDSLLYTKAVIESMPDGTSAVRGTWNIRMAKKQLVLSLQK